MLKLPGIVVDICITGNRHLLLMSLMHIFRLGLQIKNIFIYYMRLFFLLVTSLLLISCNYNSNNSKTANENNEPASAAIGKNINPADSIFNNVTVVQFPYTDSTNFNNFKETIQLTPAIADTLNLKALHSLNAAYFIRYKIHFSENFTSVAITYRKGEAELFTTLINYDKSYSIIDKLDIAYDEIAESVLRKISKISADKVQVTRIYSMEETPDIEQQTYLVQQNGKFVLVK